MWEATEALARILTTLAPASSFVALLARAPGRPPIPDDPEEALKSERRRALYDLIQRTPGISVPLIKKDLDLAEGVLQHHLDKLEASGLVEVVDIANVRRVYPAGRVPTPENEVLESPAHRRVAVLVLARPDGVTSADIAQEMGVSQRMATRYLGALADADLIAAKGGGPRVFYKPAARLAQALEGHK